MHGGFSLREKKVHATDFAHCIFAAIASLFHGSE